MSEGPWPYTEATREHIRANLAGFRRRVVPVEGLRAAAVSVVLAPGHDGSSTFLLTRRTPRLNNHAGQYALPGGRLDPGEDALTAARRELHEELGIEAAPEPALTALTGDRKGRRSGLGRARTARIMPNVIKMVKVAVTPLARRQRLGPVRPR